MEALLAVLQGVVGGDERPWAAATRRLPAAPPAHQPAHRPLRAHGARVWAEPARHRTGHTQLLARYKHAPGGRVMTGSTGYIGNYVTHSDIPKYPSYSISKMDPQTAISLQHLATSCDAYVLFLLSCDNYIHAVNYIFKFYNVFYLKYTFKQGCVKVRLMLKLMQTSQIDRW